MLLCTAGAHSWLDDQVAAPALSSLWGACTGRRPPLLGGGECSGIHSCLQWPPYLEELHCSWLDHQRELYSLDVHGRQPLCMRAWLCKQQHNMHVGLDI
jgi:hypothetical protein